MLSLSIDQSLYTAINNNIDTVLPMIDKTIVIRCHMPSSPVQKTHPHGIPPVNI